MIDTSACPGGPANTTPESYGVAALSDLNTLLANYGMAVNANEPPQDTLSMQVINDPDECKIFYGDDVIEENRCLCDNFPDIAIRQGINCNPYTPIYWYHPDYIGNIEFVTDRTGQPYQHFYYAAFGDPLVSQHVGTGSFNSTFRFNAKEFDEETGNYYYGARYYQPKSSIWMGVDAMATSYPGMNPYNFIIGNPIMAIDPDGNEVDPNEYDEDGNFISTLGGSEVNFYHQKDGNILVENTNTCETQIINGGVKLFQDYKRRNSDVNWYTITSEWESGTGPEKSFFGPDHPGTISVSGEDNYVSFKGREGALNDIEDGKDMVGVGFGLVGLLRSGPDGWEQMMGSASISYYVVGDKVVYLIHDQKTRESFYYHIPGIKNKTREPYRIIYKANTYQTYLWIEDIEESKRLFYLFNSAYDTF